jgi:hypothetical protein
MIVLVYVCSFMIVLVYVCSCGKCRLTGLYQLCTVYDTLTRHRDPPRGVGGYVGVCYKVYVYALS